MSKIELTSTGCKRRTRHKLDTGEVARVHAINNGLTIHKTDGQSVGVRLANGVDTFRTLSDLMSAICRAEGAERVKMLPVVMEEHAYLHGDNGKTGVNKAKVRTTGFDFVR